jgi:hypothetical protein
MFSSIYSWQKDTGLMSIEYKSAKTKGALEYIGVGWVDHKYGLLKSIGRNHDVIVTDQDLIAHDDYIEALQDRRPTIVFLNREHGVGNKFKQQSGVGGANYKRLKAAMNKLQESGFRVLYFKNRAPMESKVKSLLGGK